LTNDIISLEDKVKNLNKKSEMLESENNTVAQKNQLMLQEIERVKDELAKKKCHENINTLI